MMIRLLISSTFSLAMFYLLAFRGPFPIIRSAIGIDRENGARYLVLQGQHVPNLLLAMAIAGIAGLLLTFGVLAITKEIRLRPITRTWKPPATPAEWERSSPQYEDIKIATGQRNPRKMD